jgi:hypothetical protein
LLKNRGREIIKKAIGVVMRLRMDGLTCNLLDDVVKRILTELVLDTDKQFGEIARDEDWPIIDMCEAEADLLDLAIRHNNAHATLSKVLSSILSMENRTVLPPPNAAKGNFLGEIETANPKAANDSADEATILHARNRYARLLLDFVASEKGLSEFLSLSYYNETDRKKLRSHLLITIVDKTLSLKYGSKQMVIDSTNPECDEFFTLPQFLAKQDCDLLLKAIFSKRVASDVRVNVSKMILTLLNSDDDSTKFAKSMVKTLRAMNNADFASAFRSNFFGNSKCSRASSDVLMKLLSSTWLSTDTKEVASQTLKVLYQDMDAWLVGDLSDSVSNLVQLFCLLSTSPNQMSVSIEEVMKFGERIKDYQGQQPAGWEDEMRDEVDEDGMDLSHHFSIFRKFRSHRHPSRSEVQALRLDLLDPVLSLLSASETKFFYLPSAKS